MKPQFQPWHLLLLILAGWINRRQQDAIEYLLTENREEYGHPQKVPRTSRGRNAGRPAPPVIAVAT